MQYFTVTLRGGQTYIFPILRGGDAFLPGAAAAPEFLAHVDALIADLRQVRDKGARLLVEQARKPLFPEA